MPSKGQSQSLAETTPSDLAWLDCHADVSLVYFVFFRFLWRNDARFSQEATVADYLRIILLLGTEYTSLCYGAAEAL